MDITISFTDDDRLKLKNALGREDVDDLVAELIARAGAREAVAQATGDAVFSGMTDLRSYRIFCLLAEGMALVEAEDVVARVFKVPPASSKRMVANAVARYVVELNAALMTALGAMLGAADWNDDVERWEVRMPASFLRDRVFDILGQVDFPDPESASRGSLWRIADETYAYLRQQAGLKPRAHP
jgi:hypothetical protein